MGSGAGMRSGAQRSAAAPGWVPGLPARGLRRSGAVGGTGLGSAQAGTGGESAGLAAGVGLSAGADAGSGSAVSLLAAGAIRALSPEMALGSGAASVRACVAGRGATTAAGIAWVGGDAAVAGVWSLSWVAVGTAALRVARRARVPLLGSVGGAAMAPATFSVGATRAPWPLVLCLRGPAPWRRLGRGAGPGRGWCLGPIRGALVACGFLRHCCCLESDRHRAWTAPAVAWPGVASGRG